MPLIEGQPNAVSRVYASSLYELASAKGGREFVEEVLGELEDILELARSDARFNEFLASRVLPVEQRAKSIREIFSSRVSPVTLNFLLVLNVKGRLAYLPSIVAAYDAKVQEQFGRVEVDVYTAGPIPSDELHAIRDKLSSVLGKDVIVHPYTDESMLGGVRLRIGDKLVDGSLSSRLRKLRDQLADHGAAAVRARAEQIIGTNGSDA